MGIARVVPDGLGAWASSVLGNTDLVCRKGLRRVRDIS